MPAQLFAHDLFLCMLGNFSCFCCSLLTFFQNQLFQNILSGTLSECQTVWIQIRTDILSVLIWVWTVCKCYQQMTKVATSKEIVFWFGLCAAYMMQVRWVLTLWRLGIFAFFLSSAELFLKLTFWKKKIFQGCHQCQSVWTQIRPDISSGLIWVQTVCKGYQHWHGKH